MLWVPQKGTLLTQSNVSNIATSSPGTGVTTGGSASTKGTAVQLIASTLFDAYWMRVVAMSYASTIVASEGALDILIGGSPEEIFISNLLMGYCGGSGQIKGPKVWDFNLYVPAGSRIAAQAAGARTSTTMRVCVSLYGGYGYPPFRVGTKVTTYGMGTVPNGTTITPGNGTLGSFAQITGSTTEDHFALVPSFQPSANTALSTLQYTVEIGLGSATETVIGLPYQFSADTNETMDGPFNSMPVFQDVPAGTRLAMRASANGSPGSSYNGVIHAIS